MFHQLRLPFYQLGCTILTQRLAVHVHFLRSLTCDYITLSFGLVILYNCHFFLIRCYPVGNWYTCFTLLQYYIKSHNVCHREYYIPHIKYIPFRNHNYPEWHVSKKKLPKKVNFYVHLNWADAHSAWPINLKILLGTTIWMWGTFSFCFRFITLIILIQFAHKMLIYCIFLCWFE